MLDDTLLIDPADAAVPEIVDELRIELRKPVTFAKVDYTHVDLTEPTVAQLRAAGKANQGIDQLATLAHLNAKIPQGAVDQFCQRDFEECGRFFERFNSPSP